MADEDVSVKHDTGKPQMRLILHSMPRAMLAIGAVANHGAEKYSPDGWLRVPNGLERYTDALMRHVVAEGISAEDPDSGLLHAAHAAWNAVARLELILRSLETPE